MATVFSLPEELLLKVFSYLSVYDVSVSVANVCTHWNSLACDSVLWNGLVFTIDKNMGLCDVLKILPQLSHLRFVTLQWRTDTTDIVEALCTHCPRLIGIKMICCGFVDRSCVKQLFNNCHNLKMFSLGKSWAVPNQCIDDIVLLTHLTTLNLSHSLLTPQQFRSISLNCTKITSINIDYVRGILEEDLEQFISLRRNQLESLSVFGELLTDTILQHVQLCLSLKLLHISTCRKFTDKCFSSIKNLKRLRSLTLRKAIQFSSEALWKFYFKSDTVKNLAYLYISAIRTVNHSDVSVWLKNNSDIQESLVNKYCTCILTKDGFKVEKILE